MSEIDHPFFPSTPGLPLGGDGPVLPFAGITTPFRGKSVEKPLHRIEEVRKSQGISLNTVAKRFGVELSVAREMENPYRDISLEELYRWQKLLDVPLSELLLDPDDLPENPIRARGQLVRLMKTARSILENANDERLKILSQMLVDQLVEIMPELINITAWPSIGQSREFKDYGQAVYRRFDNGTAASLEE